MCGCQFQVGQHGQHHYAVVVHGRKTRYRHKWAALDGCLAAQAAVCTSEEDPESTAAEQAPAALQLQLWQLAVLLQQVTQVVHLQSCQWAPQCWGKH